MCNSEKNQTGRERDPLPVWAHTSKKPSKVEKKLPSSVQPAHFPAKVVRVNEWKRRLEKAHAGLVNLYEDLATGHDIPWLNWRCLNRLSYGYTCSKSIGRSGDISTETQHVTAGLQQRARLTCCNAHSSHTPAPWTTF